MAPDDYVTKPFSTTELVARVDAIHRRVTMARGGSEQQIQEIKNGPFILNYKSRSLTKDGKIIDLTQVEYLLMELFLKNPDTALGRSEILSKFGEKTIMECKNRRCNIRGFDEN